MEGASTLMHKVDDNQRVRDEEMLDELSLAFNRSRLQNRGKVDIDLQGVKEENEERWCRTLIGKLQTKIWFEVEDVKRELIRNWCFKSKFDIARLADGIYIVTFRREVDYAFVLENGPWEIFGPPLERYGIANIQKVGEIFGEVLMVDPVGGYDYGVCKEFRECQRNFGRELTRDEAKKVMSFSYSQKAKFFKFGAGIQTRHIIEVDLIAEMNFEDRHFREWQEEGELEEERRKMKLTESTKEIGQVLFLTNMGTLETDLGSTPKRMVTEVGLVGILSEEKTDGEKKDALNLITQYPSPNLDPLLKEDPTPKDNVSAFLQRQPLISTDHLENHPPPNIAEQSTNHHHVVDLLSLTFNVGKQPLPTKYVSKKKERLEFLKRFFKTTKQKSDEGEFSKKREREKKIKVRVKKGVAKNQKMVTIFSCDARRGSAEMKEGVRDEATQQRINEVVRIMKLYQKGGKPSDVEE
ncbi:hypothetical protein FRX31_033446 [Thalictrum thalictroides]|uniref:DUF4283 domain-containing protein n=1 Tax=Thalictrum thalictroides TaxID=46969 RepID=A0A7J6UWI9_THATH|nr:hypothetical protein FRX31_033446 [Thalictrum thalictroides]